MEICDFTGLAATLPPDDLVALLNRVFTALDEIVHTARAYKVSGGKVASVARNVRPMLYFAFLPRTQSACVVDSFLLILRLVPGGDGRASLHGFVRLPCTGR